MGDGASDDGVRLLPWEAGDLQLLQSLTGDGEMMRHLGGAETAQQIAARHARYLQREQPGTGRTLKIVDTSADEAAGWVGYWRRDWHGEQIYEIGWSVLPAAQGRGIATAATAQAIALARLDDPSAPVHAFLAVANLASNAICRRLGFALARECEFEYPPGSLMRCNDWRLSPAGPAADPR